MAKLSSKIFMLLIAALIIATIAGPAVSVGAVTSVRSMPASAIPGETFTVTVTINVDENDPPSALTVNERVPSGLAVGEANPPFFNNAGGSLLWIITPSQSGGKITDQTITYTVSGTTPGAYAFNGNVYAGSNSASTEGSITVKIKVPCTESWSCGEWTACQGGAQQRECTDSSSCPLPESRPAMSQSCTVAAASGPAPEDQDNQGQVTSSGGSSSNTVSGNNTSGNATINATSSDAAINESTSGQSAAGNDKPEDTAGDSQDSDSPQITEDKENKTGEQMITGKATDSQPGEKAEDSSFSQVSAGNSASGKSSPPDNSSIPLLTIVLAVILAAMIAILGMKKLNLG